MESSFIRNSIPGKEMELRLLLYGKCPRKGDVADFCTIMSVALKCRAGLLPSLLRAFSRFKV